jgi:N-methylhydantoinase B/oxoprolinase/acetone carboxylase alpha subunit
VNARTATIKRIADVLFGASRQPLPERWPAASSGALVVMSLAGVDLGPARASSRARSGPAA